MKKTVLLTLAVVLLVGLSGCAGGGGGGDGGDGSGDGGPTTSVSGGGGGGDGDGGDGGDGAGGGDGGGFEPVDYFEDIRTERQMADYIDRSPFPVYRPGEYLKYEGRSTYDSQTDSLQPVTMTIQSGNGGEWLEADLEVTLVRGGQTMTFTEEDPEMMFTPELSLTANGRSWVWLFRYNMMTNVNPRISELSVGDTWRFDGDDGNGLAFSVPRKETYAGVDCMYIVTEQFDADDERTVFSETCVAPDVGLPLYFAQYDDDGLVFEVELVDYSR